MSQRNSGYTRLADDKYYTPAWCTEALLPHLRIQPPAIIHEPAAGAGHIVRALQAAHYRVIAADISRGMDFLNSGKTLAAGIVTNPPYGMAEQFIAHALDLTEPNGFVAMLLRADYDHAMTRAYLFDNHPFAMRIALRRRIRWIEGSTGSPSFNHSWFVWDWKHKGPPIIRYAP